MATWRVWCTRIGLLAMLGLLIPACKSKHVGAALFSEGFNGTFPGANWTTPVTTGTGTTTQIDSTAGNPAPSLKITTTGATSSSKTDTTAAFNNPTVTISAHLAVLSTPVNLLGMGTISILDATPSVVASASWDN